MISRNISKQLAGVEDLLTGEGTATQTRAGAAHTISKLNIVWPIDTLAALKQLDPTAFPKVHLLGNVAKGDGFGVDYYWAEDDISVADDVTVIASTARTTGRWLRLYTDSSYFNPPTTASMQLNRYAPGLRITTSEFSTGNGGGGEYLVTTGDTSNGSNKLLLADGNTAELQIKNAPTFNQFGAAGNGTTPADTAINAAIDWIRQSNQDLTPTTGQIVINQRVKAEAGSIYLINTGIDATGMPFRGWTLDFTGATILGDGSGITVIDYTASAYGTTNGLKIKTDSTNKPAIGVQQARIEATTVASKLTFNDLDISGFFTLTCVYNMASEISVYNYPRLYNYQGSTTSWCMMFDGNNHYDASSQFQTIAIAQNTAMSCIQHTMQTADIRKPVSGPAIYVTRTDQLKFYNSYCVAKDNHAVLIESDGQEMKDHDWDMHFETTGLSESFLFARQSQLGAGDVVLRGWKHKDHASQAATVILRVLDANTNNVIIDGVNLDLAKFQLGLSSGLVLPNSKFTMSGYIYIGDASELKGFDFDGTIVSDNIAAGTYGTGNVVLIDRVTGKSVIKGTMEYIGKDASTLLGSNIGTAAAPSSTLADASVISTPRSTAPTTAAGVATYAVDDGTNWSGVNATGNARPVFHDGAAWIAMT